MEVKDLGEQLLLINYPQNLENVYSEESLKNETERYENLIKKFEEVFENLPDFIVRAPGRVNLIGEHIDYEGFAVLPMAVENDIVIAFKNENVINFENTSTTYSLEIVHVDPNKFKTYKFQNLQKLEKINFTNPHDWINYVIAGYNAIINHIEQNDLNINQNNSLKIKLIFTGNVPHASGLSSSSALTVATSLAFVKIFNIENQITKKELANACINYERSVGTACGGMDQTISIYAEKNKAKLIEFYPELKTKTVNLPANVTFIIANSLTDSPKIDTLAYRYNKRVVENKLALAIISKKLKLTKIYSTLIELKTALELNFGETAKILNDHLKDKEYTIDDIKYELNSEESEIDFSIDAILNRIPHYQFVLESNSHFTLKNRLFHVIEEAERVLKFYNICSDESSVNDKVQELGTLMNHSHLSCKELYECSSKELDALVNFAMKHQAVGARLTGAGWGGCCIIMVRNENLDYLMESLKKFYIENYGKFISENLDFSNFYFTTKASQGACVMKINK